MAVPTDITYTVDGTTVSSKTFAYGTIETFVNTTINDEDIIKVYHEGTLLTLTTHYTVDDNNKNVIIDAGFTLTIGDSLVVQRETDIDSPFVDYANNSTIESSDLDLSTLQTLFSLQELQTDTNNSLKYDVATGCYDALGRKICNVLSGTASTDGVNLGQVQNLIAGVDTASVDNLTRWTFTGNGSTTAFTLTSPPSGLTDGSQVVVSIGGVHQIPTTHYTLAKGATTVVTMGSAPLSGETIEVYTVEGIVSVTFPDGSITGAALEDDSIGVDKINVGAGSANRFLVFNTSGDPTAQTVDHTLISDFDTGVRQNRLDQMTAPTASVFLNSQKLTGVLSGSASTDGVNKGQMDAAITAAIPSGSTDIGGVTEVQTTSASFLASTPYIVSNAGSTAMFVTVEVGTSSTDFYRITTEVKTSAGSYIETATTSMDIEGTLMTTALTALVPAGGSARFTTDNNMTRYRVTTQAFS